MNLHKSDKQQFHKLILRWFDQHGRKTLPWQQNKTPYRVWISEIMLQQTQVNTVIPYFERFMQYFPDLSSLANAHEDEVLHLWSGLGYYSRARNLRRAANMIMQQFGGQFPQQTDELKQLPGIGPSTAGAIRSIAFEQPAAILDGNVKRVLARFHGITHPINEKSVENSLWELAEHYLPTNRVADYTQAMMDLGATLCTRSKPQCDRCPLTKHCCAQQQGMTDIIPINKKTRELPTRIATFIIIKNNKQVLLQKRRSAGIWGGLFSFPEIAGVPERDTVRQFCRQHFHITIRAFYLLKPFRHTFSHYHLDIHPVVINLKKTGMIDMVHNQQIWYNPHHPESVGLPTPVQAIMRGLE